MFITKVKKLSGLDFFVISRSKRYYHHLKKLLYNPPVKYLAFYGTLNACVDSNKPLTLPSFHQGEEKGLMERGACEERTN
jgi:hypothetical protein